MTTFQPPTPAALKQILEAADPTKNRRRIFLLSLLLLTAFVAISFWYVKASKSHNPSAAYATEELRLGDIALVITATGTLEPTNKVTVGSELSGTTLAVYVDSNDHVTLGQPLAKLDTNKLGQLTESSRATVLSAKARVVQAEATLKERHATLVRLKELSRASGGRIPAQADLEAAEASAERAQADLQSAQAAVGEAQASVQINESDLAKAIIKSPIDGIVLKRNLEPGQTVAATFTAPELFVIAEKLEHMKLKIAVSESDIGRVAAGQHASFTVDAWPNRAYSAVVAKVFYGSTIADNVVTYQVDLEVPNNDLTLRPGMTATADIRVVEVRDVLLVPSAALRFDPAVASATQNTAKSTQSVTLFSGPSKDRGKAPVLPEAAAKLAPGSARIWILKNGRPEPILVKLGVSDGRVTEISAVGLAAGTPVITHANLAAP